MSKNFRHLHRIKMALQVTFKKIPTIQPHDNQQKTPKLAETLRQEPHTPKSSPTPTPTPSSSPTKTFLIGEHSTPFTLPTPLLPPLLHALPTNTHLHQTTPETFALLNTYLKTSTYNPPAHLPLASKLECHIALYNLSTRYEVPGLAFQVLTKVHAILALLIPHDRGYFISPAGISCCEKWSLVRLVYGCGGEGEGGGGMRRLWAGFLAANWGWYVKSGLVNGRIDARSDVGRALEEVHGLKEDLLVALGAGGWFLPPVEGGG